MSDKYQPLFDHLYNEHGLTLLESEMEEIIRVVNEITSYPVDSLSLIQAKDAAINEGKKIRHKLFAPDEFLKYEIRGWWTEDGCQMFQSYWKRISKNSSFQDGWSVVE